MEHRDPRVEDGVRHHEAIYGETPPTTPEEARSGENGTASEHPYDSIMEDAEMEVASYLFSENYSSDPKAERVENEYGPHINRNIVDDPKSVDAVEEITGEKDDPLEPEDDVMTDGGQYQAVESTDQEEYDEETPWERYGIIP